MAKRKPLSLTTRQVLATIKRRGPDVSNNDLVDRTGASPQTIVDALRTLEQRGYIRRSGGRYRRIMLLKGRFQDRPVTTRKMRKCLRCRHDFMSDSLGNRVCTKCKDAVDKADANPYLHEFV